MAVLKSRNDHIGTGVSFRNTIEDDHVSKYPPYAIRDGRGLLLLFSAHKHSPVAHS